MFGYFSVNDDWLFLRQVEAFAKGNYKLSAEIDPSFIMQGLIGLLWGKVFGISFTSLQVLTFLITVIGMFGFILVLRELNIKKEVIALSAILFFFNPLIFTSSFSFMTENYYLTFFIFAVYFYLKFLKDENKLRNLLIGSLFMIMASMVRQVGVLLGLSLLGMLIIRLKIRQGERSLYWQTATILIFLAGSFTIPLLWPTYGNNRALILLENTRGRINLILLSIHYLPLFIFPLFYTLRAFLRRNLLLSAILFTLIALFLYRTDVFPVGNVLYLEDLYSKSDFRSNFSIFDNILFKITFISLISLSFVKVLLYIKAHFKSIKLDEIDRFLILTTLLNYGILFVSSDFYDRYLLPSFTGFFILFLKKTVDIKLNNAVILTSVLLIFISVTLQWEHISQSKLKWNQASMLSGKTGLYRQIDLNDTYTNYIITKIENDYTGLITRRSFEKRCFVQQYTTDSTKTIFVGIKKFDDYILSNFITNKKPLGVKKNTEIPRIKNNLDKLTYNQEYFSLLYNLVGKRAYVGSWCLMPDST